MRRRPFVRTADRTCSPGIRRLATLWLLVLSATGAAAEGAGEALRYDLLYVFRPVPAEGIVQVRVVLEQDRNLLREMRFASSRISNVEGDGTLRRDGDDYVWSPPATGGTLKWQADVRHKRNSGGYDAWLDESWGLFRAEDVVPRAASRAQRGASSDTRMRFDLPGGWSAVTEYRDFDGSIPVTPAGRYLTQPTGWIVIGELGVRREQIAGTRVAVAGPVGEDVRRMDMLALLNWTLPELARILPHEVPRITIVSAGKPMWRGALSAPQSFYIHADRPLISENGTSTLLHEVMHVSMDTTAERGYDWILEGIAEYYSLELLRRSGSITLPRYVAALDDLRNWGKSANKLCDRSSTGAETALAVTVLRALDLEIDEVTEGDHNLDDVLYAMLAQGRKLTLDMLRNVSRELMGKTPDALRDKRLPGCAAYG